jgi:23S rRNA (guanine2445-N2)-methyltransferase / 23S rRNA (guanine2069-N7)-methyltransferase
MRKQYQKYFATCPKGLEDLLFHEISDLGGKNPKQTTAGVSFKGTLETAYRICLWSRLANRVLMPIAHFTADTPDMLYDQVYSSVAWNDHMNEDGTFAVDFSASGGKRFHSQYAALRVKDAVVDQFMAGFGRRPSIDRDRPDIRINVYMKHDRATLSLDLSGESLHKRGLRKDTGPATLKENLAAAILIRAGWPDMIEKGAPLVDPMCGSGTILIEAAMMAFDRAPGLSRDYFGFLGWKGHEEKLWKVLHEEAETRAVDGRRKKTRFYGFDSHGAAVRQAKANIARAKLSGSIQVVQQDIRALKAPDCENPGLLITNPPYGERMGDIPALDKLYRDLGEQLTSRFSGWRASIFTGNPDLAKQMRICAKKQYRLYNGALPCMLFNFEVTDQWVLRKRPVGSLPRGQKGRSILDANAEMFANRIKKNLKNIGKWAQKHGIECYRLYDADMPEYAVAVDMYRDWAHVQEYEAPKTVSPKMADKRLAQVLSLLPDLPGFSSEKVVLKKRKRTCGRDQYNKFGSSGNMFWVKENDLEFAVNLTDYLDTGLFLDQRMIRQHIRELSHEKRMLNLFCYTAAASIYAAAGGAGRTMSVDMSRTYLDWAKKNFKANGFKAPRHEMIQADCLEWIKTCKVKYDLIFLSPPTFSNSKRMNRSFDIQRDHAELIEEVMNLLLPDGLLIFSSNRRKFRLAEQVSARWNVKDISAETLPKDFKRSQKSHHCFEIS